jgi:anaerobic magnesium-protoporphyrin IX monomethyl ester cyclase
VRISLKNKITRVLLIQPAYKLKYADVPLGLLYLATYLKSRNLDVRIFMGKPELLIPAIKKFRPQLVGLYATTLHYPAAKTYLKKIKNESREIITFVGGPHPSLEPERVIANPNVDGIIIGEGEESFYAFIAEHNRKKSDWNKLDGIYLKTKNGIVQRPKTRFSDLQKIPMPDYSLIDMEKQVKYWPYLDYEFNVVGTSLITSRGCPFSCTYCQPIPRVMFGSSIRRHSVQQVLSKMDELNKMYGINAFFFHDDTFITDKKWVSEFCLALIKGRRNYRWVCNTRVDTISEDIVSLMAKANCKEIRLGIESVNPSVLKFYKKNTPVEMIDKSIGIIKKHGIRVFGFFMIGAPFETKSMIRKTLDYAVNSQLDFARFSILVTMPGTDLSRELSCCYRNESGFDYIKGSQNNCSQIKYSYLVFMRRLSYLRFYFNAKRLITTLISLRSRRGLMAKLERF